MTDGKARVAAMNTKHLQSVLLAVGLVLALSAVTGAQRIVVDVNLTTIGVRVANDDGSPALDLSVGDFEILEDGQPRPISHFSMEYQPAAIGLLVDRSISVGPVGRELLELLL